MKKDLKIAIVQDGPVYLDKEKSMEKAVSLIETASTEGAELIVFGETWLSGYPAWLDHCPEMGLWDHPATKEVFVQMYQNSVEVPGPETKIISQLARQHSVVIGIGVNEVVARGHANGTIFNSFLLFDEQGRLAVHHRKLMPTFTEKMVYGHGDGHGLRAASTSLGRIGGLICWEHWMPLTRQAMHLEAEHIHLALWPKVHDMLQVASRSYAFEARCFVIAAGQIMRASDIPDGLKLPEHLAKAPETMILNGGSCIFGPDGSILLAPQFDVEGILYHELKNIPQLIGEKMALDTSGHYNRNDVFRFGVKRKRVQ
ncbi:MAG: carbon-nitrogen hydrolase family protein [Bacteroidota bacterium]